MFKQKINKEKKEKIYICTACYLETSPYGDGKFQGIFLSDMYLKQKNGKYVNVFNENEVFSDDNIRLNRNDIQIIIREEKDMTLHEAFWDMFYNPNYCKDRVAAMNDFLGEDRSKLQSMDFNRYRQIMETDLEIESRYDRFSKNKVLVLKGR